MKCLLLIFIPFALNGMTPAFLCNATATITATAKAATTAQNFTKAVQALGAVMQIKAFIKSPLDAIVCYGVDKGVGIAYPPLKDWIAWQMSGEIAKLTAKKTELLTRIAEHPALPMHIEHRELATIEHILSKKITVALSEIANGTHAQAENAMKNLYGERMVYMMQKMGDKAMKPAINMLELYNAEKLFEMRFNKLPAMMDMVNTSLMLPRDVIKETVEEVFADMQVGKYSNFESFMVEVGKRTQLLKDMGLLQKTPISTTSIENQLLATENIETYITHVVKTVAKDLKSSEALKIMCHLNIALHPLSLNAAFAKEILKAINAQPDVLNKLNALPIQNSITIGHIWTAYTESIASLKGVGDCSAVASKLINELDSKVSELYKAQQAQLFKLMAHTDMSLTTPTDPDLLFRQRVIANPETDFKEYIRQVGQVMHELGSKGLYTAEQVPIFTLEVTQGIAKHFAYVVQHPIKYTKDSIIAIAGLAKEIALFTFDVYSSPEELYVSDQAMAQYEQLVATRGKAMIEKYDQMCAAIPQMSRSEWADLISKSIVDILVTHGVSKGASFVKNAKLPAAIIEHPLFSKIQNLEQAMARQAELVTTEGVAFKVPQAMQEADILKNAAENKSFKKIADSIAKAAEQEANLATITVEDLVKIAKPGEAKSASSIQYELPGGYKEALKDFDSLHLKDVRDISNAKGLKKVGTLESGEKVVVRNHSDSGMPTLEIQKEMHKIKFRYKS